MDWINGMNEAVNFIEENLCEDLSIEDIASRCFSSSYHFQRMFSLISGITVGEYIRKRRLTLAGKELISEKSKIIDTALKYGYENPDSFTRAFQAFHGITPSECKKSNKPLKSFSRLEINFSLKGGNMMNYRIEEQPAMTLTGFKTCFHGLPEGKERAEQEKELFITTRGKQWFLQGAACDSKIYCLITDVTEQGYNFRYCHKLDDWTRSALYNKAITGVDFIEDLKLENIDIPKQTYVIFEAKPDNIKDTIPEYQKLLDSKINLLSSWLPEMGFQLADAPEMAVYNWMPRNDRSVEIRLPVEKIK